MPKILKAQNIQTDLIGSNGNNAFSLQRNNSSLLTLSTNERVGIGTTSPGYRLTVQSTSGTDSQLGLVTTSQAINTGAELQMDLTNASNQQFEGGSILVRHSTGNQTANAENAYMVFQTRLNGTVAERLRINPNGDVGIGETSPASKLHIKGASGTASEIRITCTTANAGGKITFYENASAAHEIGSTGGNNVFYIKDAYNNAERLRITSGGFLKASDSGTYVNSTASFHEFRNSTSNEAIVVSNSNAVPYGIQIRFTQAPNDATSYFLNCNDGNGATSRAIIRSNGGFVNYQSNDGNLSDERLKTDIQPSPSYLDKICSIPVVNFKYKDQTHDDYNLGVIAQQVEAVCPELVDSDGVGEIPEDGVPLKSIYQTDLQYALMKAIQELKTENDSLKSRIAALENQ